VTIEALDEGIHMAVLKLLFIIFFAISEFAAALWDRDRQYQISRFDTETETWGAGFSISILRLRPGIQEFPY